MSSQFKNWLRGRKKQRVMGDPPMPTLPKSRARPLSAIPPKPNATVKSRFFQLLPAEIRRRILIEAFGELPMHIDLRLEHPRRKEIGPSGYHADIPGTYETYKPQQWLWTGVVCHRLAPRPLSVAPGLDTMFRSMPPDDSCLGKYRGNTPECSSWPGEHPTKCKIGAMGWLRACRQAYIEGIEVLYSTNKLHIDGIFMFRNLPDILLRQRVVAIRMVELLWDLNPYGNSSSGGQYPPGSDMASFISSLEAFPSILPNLTFLYLSLQGNLIPHTVTHSRYSIPEIPPDNKEIISASDTLLSLVDRMVVKLPLLSDCRIALPLSHYCTHKYRLKRESIIPRPEDEGNEALWRDLPPEAGTRNNLSGYWICLGQRDIGHTRGAEDTESRFVYGSYGGGRWTNSALIPGDREIKDVYNLSVLRYKEPALLGSMDPAIFKG
ncbi:hypothetical protein FQN55_001370 [Onygenales sp. PD_40]|nr:hypothetical protein FQN55_001370 [Onygenales sp. PD_40]